MVKKPQIQRIVQCKWIFKIKEINSNDPLKYKVRLVANNFTQRKAVDYNEIFSPVIKYKTIRFILALVVQFNWELEQLDIKIVFLHGELEDDIYMSQPQGFEEKGKLDFVYKLQKSLYGLKQSHWQWYIRFDTYVLKISFRISEYDHCLYYNNTKVGSEV